MAENSSLVFFIPITLPSNPLTTEATEQQLLTELRENIRSIKGALWKLALLYTTQGLHSAALTHIEQLHQISNDPEEKAFCSLSMGQTLEQMQRFEEATARYLEGLKLDPTDAKVAYLLHNNVGFCLNHAKRFSDAENYCRKAIEINPNRHNAHKNLGISLEGQGQPADAVHAYIAAIRTNAADPRALMHLENLVTSRPELAQAIPDLHQQLEGARHAVQLIQRLRFEAPASKAQCIEAAPGLH